MPASAIRFFEGNYLLFLCNRLSSASTQRIGEIVGTRGMLGQPLAIIMYNGLYHITASFTAY